ncbi:MAG: hypothetical protein IPJ66_13680 [Bacteroidetes bacterium]|nr:hypothetical protein [Bacteroidota bacterium]
MYSAGLKDNADVAAFFRTSDEVVGDHDRVADLADMHIAGHGCTSRWHQPKCDKQEANGK